MMPALPRVVTNAAERATGADVELTPLTAIDQQDENVWRQRFQKQVHRHMRAVPPVGEAASYYDPRSRFSPSTPPSIELPRKIRVTQKKRISRWRLIFMLFLVLSVTCNVVFIVLFVRYYNRFHKVRNLWNEIFSLEFFSPASSHTPTPSG